jgi:hypothetical protein
VVLWDVREVGIDTIHSQVQVEEGRKYMDLVVRRTEAEVVTYLDQR